jgi:hypothetical protein
MLEGLPFSNSVLSKLPSPFESVFLNISSANRRPVESVLFDPVGLVAPSASSFSRRLTRDDVLSLLDPRTELASDELLSAEDSSLLLIDPSPLVSNELKKLSADVPVFFDVCCNCHR